MKYFLTIQIHYIVCNISIVIYFPLQKSIVKRGKMFYVARLIKSRIAVLEQKNAVLYNEFQAQKIYFNIPSYTFHFELMCKHSFNIRGDEKKLYEIFFIVITGCFQR